MTTREVRDVRRAGLREQRPSLLNPTAPASPVLKEVYERLRKVYDVREWWPHRNWFEVVVGAVLAQNTSWKNVEKSLKKLDELGALTPERILELPLGVLEDAIKSSGFYKRKVRTLKEISAYFLSEDWKNKDTVSLREDLLKIKGIGKETADTILLYALGRRIMVVDRYTYRILTRLGVYKGPYNYERIRELIEREMPQDVETFKRFHALLVEHAKHVCKKEPLCKECPLKDVCGYGGDR